MRGANQSTDTKYATSILCDALVLLESGRVYGARLLMIKAISLLPHIDDSTQNRVEAEQKRTGD